MAKKHNAVADPDSPPTVAEIRDVARAIGDGDARLIGDGGRTNLRLTQHVILGYLLLGTMVREEGGGGAVVPKKVVSHGSMHSWQQVGALATIVSLIILNR
jgi:hypothetical protein